MHAYAAVKAIARCTQQHERLSSFVLLVAQVHNASESVFMHAGRHADKRTDGWTDGRMDGWTDGRMDGWMDGRAGGQAGRRAGGQAGRRAGGQAGRQTETHTHKHADRS